MLITRRIWSKYYIPCVLFVPFLYPWYYLIRLDFFQAVLKIKIHLTIFVHLYKNISYVCYAVITFLMIWLEEACQFYINIPDHVITSPFICATIEHLEFLKFFHILIWSHLIGDFKRLNTVEEGINLGLQVKMWPNHKTVASYLKKEIFYGAGKCAAVYCLPLIPALLTVCKVNAAVKNKHRICLFHLPRSVHMLIRLPPGRPFLL